MRILIAEDHPDNREMLTRRLERRGYEVHCAENGAEAVENTPAGHVVAATRLETVGSAEYATITVTDNGPGFSREVLGRVFDPYVTSKPKGTGLGLAIVKKIVEEHGGRVEADNRPEGGGRVRVSLPVTDGSRQMVARDRRAEPRKERA